MLTTTFKMIEYLRDQGQQATVTPEIRRYLQDIVVFLRMERSVDGGISPFATTQLLSLAKYAHSQRTKETPFF